MEKRIQKLIGFTPEMVQMVNDIKEKRGLGSFTAVVHYAIAELHGRVKPPYSEVNKTRRTPEERLKDRQEEKAIKEKVFRDGQLKILEELGGELVVRSGNEFAKYYTYNWKTRYEQEVPLAQLSRDLLVTQYQPSREKVEELRAEGKTEY